MPLAKKTTPTILPEELENQIRNNFTKDTEESANIQIESVSAKSKYSDTVNLHLTTGKRTEFKSFFAQHEITMNQGFEIAVDYLIREVKAGRLKVSKSGIAKTDE